MRLEVVNVNKSKVKFIGKGLNEGKLIIEDITGNRRYTFDKIPNEREIVVNLLPGIYVYYLIFDDFEYKGRVVVN